MHRITIQPSSDPYNRFAQQVMRTLLSKHGFSLGPDGDITIVGLDPRAPEPLTLSGEKVIVHGYLPEHLIPAVLEKAEHVSLIANENAHQIIDVVEEMLHGSSLEIIAPDEKTPLPSLGSDPLLVVPIQPAFDAPFLTHAISSWPRDEIIAAAAHKAAVVTLHGNDLCAYGTEEIWRSSLPELVKDVLAAGSTKILLGRMSTRRLKPIIDEITALLAHPRVIKRLWLAMDAGSNDSLSRMGAKHTIDDYKALVGKARTAVPGLTLRTDLFVGAPGETVEDFNQTLETLREVRPDEAEIVDGSALPGAPLEEKMRETRLRTARDVAGSVSTLQSEQWLDWSGECVAVANAEDGTTELRNRSWKRIDVPRRHAIGALVRATAQYARSWGLKGEEKR